MNPSPIRNIPHTNNNNTKYYDVFMMLYTSKYYVQSNCISQRGRVLFVTTTTYSVHYTSKYYYTSARLTFFCKINIPVASKHRNKQRRRFKKNTDGSIRYGLE
jgi:hypothetical protein